MKKNLRAGLCLLFFGIASGVVSTTAFATNGLNIEGYGAIATGMGGASMAYDNGAAAVMNNPATLGLMPEGNRLDVSLGYGMPDIQAACEAGPCAGQSSKSSASFFIPTIGWVAKSGPYAYGAGFFTQGGVGTEYDANSFLAMGSGDKVRSELYVRRLIVPFVYNAAPNLSVGASLDYVWASLDLKMALPGSSMAGMVTNCTGAACAGLGTLAATPVTRLDFSGGGDSSGAAKGGGFAGKIGATYTLTPEVNVGVTYHSKTKMSDLDTKSNGASMSAGSPGAMGVLGTGKISVRDFQWPETYALGVAWKASNALLVVFDIKQINWKAVMKDFKMTYDGAVGAGSAAIDFAMPQNWKDQTVFEVGAGYMVNPEWTVRAGLNYANNQIPDTDLNYLFPAIEKTHVTLGAGYLVSKASSVDASFVYAPEVKQTAGSGVTMTHSQTNVQLSYSYRF